jgi:hypothetical protein
MDHYPSLIWTDFDPNMIRDLTPAFFPNHISNPQASHPIPLEIITHFKYRVKLAASNIDYNIS